MKAAADPPRDHDQRQERGASRVARQIGRGMEQSQR
jgi:hypothetical protein